MEKQRGLPFVEEESFEDLWERFPEGCQKEVAEHYARLIARAAGMESARRKQKEKNHERGV